MMNTFKVSICTITLFSLLIQLNICNAQVTDKEKRLKNKADKEKVDSTGGWKIGGTFNNTFSQTGLVNWASGGQNSIAINSLLNIYANKKIGKMLWENDADLAFGLLRQGARDSMNFVQTFFKSDDKLEISSKLGRQISKKDYFAALINFRTQFANGLDNIDDRNVISGFLSPGYWLTAVGINSKPSENLSLFVAPLTSKVTFVYDQALADAGAFGVDSSKNIRYELGGYVKLQSKSELAENITFNNNLDLFANYLTIRDLRDVDANWQTLLSMKVNKHISCTFSTHLIWDRDIDIAKTLEDGTEEKKPRIQFKEVFGAGLTYKFSNSAKTEEKKEENAK